MRLDGALVGLIALGVAAALLGACGGDGDESEIEDVTVQLGEYTRDLDPRLCGIFSQSLLEEQTQKKGKAALRACEAGIEDSKGEAPEIDEVTVSEIEVDGDTATAQVETAGETETFEYVNEGGAWKVDKVGGQGA